MTLVKADTPITQERALRDLRIMLHTAQKARSVMLENGWDPTQRVDKAVLVSLAPWLWDDRKCVLPALSKLIERCEKTGKVPYIDYYNMMIVAQQTPTIAVGAIIAHERELPGPEHLKLIMEGLGCDS
jgi:hypothetical protein